VYTQRYLSGLFVSCGGSELEVPLDATTEDSAIAEAKRAWSKRVAHAKAGGYEKAIFSPRVVYKFSIQ